MKDDKGLYYYPYPDNKKTRMYVKKTGGTVWFRIWNSDIPELWDEHGWVPYDAIRKAAEMRPDNPGGFDPKKAYDLQIANAILDEEKS